MKENDMEAQLNNYFDSWTQSQKLALENILGAQKQLRAQWMDSMQKVQDSLAGLPVQDNPQAKEAAKLFNTWFSTMLTASQAISEEALKVQETLNGALEKQVAISREVVSTLAQMAKPAKQK
jgi:hypothetical protein